MSAKNSAHLLKSLALKAVGRLSQPQRIFRLAQRRELLAAAHH
ncbi:hypothetical protein C4J92_1784 [Pseudomonas sp. R3-18-08]|nr:hypothetical protein C4J92_1784 [Pseudomonas sp. R3-18-08]AZF47145.1 hypothetical protein C4J86_1900 [Pseudomonas sp. R2-7-07]AZF57694.1 hypothetical protein C4J84_1807 [Pseudomonas sp. R11-23-07]